MDSESGLGQVFTYQNWPRRGFFKLKFAENKVLTQKIMLYIVIGQSLNNIWRIKQKTRSVGLSLTTSAQETNGHMVREK